MNSGASISASTNLGSQIYYESFDNEDVTLETTHDTVYVTGRSGSGKALSTIGQTVAGLQWIQKTTDSTLSTDVIGVSFFMKFHTDVADKFIFDNRDNTDCFCDNGFYEIEQNGNLVCESCPEQAECIKNTIII